LPQACFAIAFAHTINCLSYEATKKNSFKKFQAFFAYPAKLGYNCILTYSSSDNRIHKHVVIKHHHAMLKDLTQKWVQFFWLLILDTPELTRPTFFKTWFLVHKMWLKLARTEFFDFFEKVSFFTVFVLRISLMCSTTWKTSKIATKGLKICQFWPILTNFSYILWIFNH
jgi:hypothetical protein